MSETRPGGPPQRAVERGVAVATMLFAAIVIGGSISAGIGWGAEGPKAGFFPFYVGLLILGAGIVNFANAGAGDGVKRFAQWGELRQVLSVVIPAAVYVALIPWIGMYVASGLLIGFFMKRLGRYGWGLTALIAIAVPVITFVVFEKWFLVPLPKGPAEELLGL